MGPNNPNINRTYNYIYRLTNALTGMEYIGVHRTDNLNDGYMGSGKAVLNAIKKYGRENFTKKILEWFDDNKSMYQREYEIVTEEFILRKDTYNFRRGGLGGFDHLNDGSQSHIDRTRRAGKRCIEILKEKRMHIYSPDYVSPFTLNPDIQKMGNSPEVRIRAKEKAKRTFKEIGHSQGEKNSQYGTCWITKDDINKKIKKNESIYFNC
jgi:hypothetical protein